MADVFLSYKKEDAALVERYAKALQAAGLTVWWDDALTPQESWDATIERELAAAGAVVVLWTPRSVPSEWVRREAHYAQDRRKLVPVMAEKTEIPIAFTLNQTVNLEGWSGDTESRQWRKLLIWVVDLAATKPGNANLPGSLPAGQHNRFRESIGTLPSGEAFSDGSFITMSAAAGTAFRDLDHFPVMRIIPAGSFLLGASTNDPDSASYEMPQIRIEIPLPFAMGVLPVTVEEYRAFIPKPAPPPAINTSAKTGFFQRHFSQKPTQPTISTEPNTIEELPGFPVTNLSFNDAQAFVDKLSAASKETYRLPSESEWEYACRGGTQTPYYCGTTISSQDAAFALEKGPVAPGHYPANAFGLFDMHGNVREWTADLWHDSFSTMPGDGRPDLSGHSALRVVRGGAWSDPPSLVRSATRMRSAQYLNSALIGLRVVRNLTRGGA